MINITAAFNPSALPSIPAKRRPVGKVQTSHRAFPLRLQTHAAARTPCVSAPPKRRKRRGFAAPALNAVGVQLTACASHPDSLSFSFLDRNSRRRRSKSDSLRHDFADEMRRVEQLTVNADGKSLGRVYL